MNELLLKIQTLSKLSKETTGGSFSVYHLETGKMKIQFACRQLPSAIPRKLPEYLPEQYGEMLDEAIALIQTNRRPGAPHEKKPFTMFKKAY